MNSHMEVRGAIHLLGTRRVLDKTIRTMAHRKVHLIDKKTMAIKAKDLPWLIGEDQNFDLIYNMENVVMVFMVVVRMTIGAI